MYTDNTYTQNKDILIGLEKTKELLLEKGWIKGSFASNGGYCLYGAAMKAHDIENFKDRTKCFLKSTQILHNLINNYMKNNDYYNNVEIVSIGSFNDCKSTTLENILDLLDKAIQEVKDKIKIERLLEESYKERIKQLA